MFRGADPWPDEGSGEGGKGGARRPGKREKWGDHPPRYCEPKAKQSRVRARRLSAAAPGLLRRCAPRSDGRRGAMTAVGAEHESAAAGLGITHRGVCMPPEAMRNLSERWSLTALLDDLVAQIGRADV